MEREVEPGSSPGGCQNVALVDIKDIRQDFDLREARGKCVGIAPVRRRAPVIEEARRRKHEDAGADRQHARAAFMRRYQSLA